MSKVLRAKMLTPAFARGPRTDARTPTSSNGNGPASARSAQPVSALAPSGTAPSGQTTEVSAGVRVTEWKGGTRRLRRHVGVGREAEDGEVSGEDGEAERAHVGSVSEARLGCGAASRTRILHIGTGNLEFRAALWRRNQGEWREL